MKKTKRKTAKQPRVILGELNAVMPETGQFVHVVYDISVDWVAIGWTANGIPQGHFSNEVSCFVNSQIIAENAHLLTLSEVGKLIDLWVKKTKRGAK